MKGIIVTVSFKKTPDGWNIARLTRQGIGPDKDTLVIVNYKHTIAIIAPDTFAEIDGKKTDEPLVLCYSNEPAWISNTIDDTFNKTIGDLITGDRFDKLLKLRDSGKHFNDIMVNYDQDAMIGFRALYKYEIL